MFSDKSSVLLHFTFFSCFLSIDLNCSDENITDTKKRNDGYYNVLLKQIVYV